MEAAVTAEAEDIMASKEKRLCILGSTGSIGTQTIDIIGRHGGFKVVSLSAKSNIDKSNS